MLSLCVCVLTTVALITIATCKDLKSGMGIQTFKIRSFHEFRAQLNLRRFTYYSSQSRNQSWDPVIGVSQFRNPGIEKCSRIAIPNRTVLPRDERLCSCGVVQAEHIIFFISTTQHVGCQSQFVVGGKQDHLLISGCGVPAP